MRHRHHVSSLRGIVLPERAVATSASSNQARRGRTRGAASPCGDGGVEVPELSRIRRTADVRRRRRERRDCTTGHHEAPGRSATEGWHRGRVSRVPETLPRLRPRRRHEGRGVDRRGAPVLGEVDEAEVCGPEEVARRSARGPSLRASFPSCRGGHGRDVGPPRDPRGGELSGCCSQARTPAPAPSRAQRSNRGGTGS